MIEKITDQNLERYDSRLKEWCDRKFFEKGNYGKYQITEEASIVSFYSAPDTLLEGKVNFLFKETMPVGGVKGLNNPSTITGVSNIKLLHCNKNILKASGYLETNGISFTDNGNGSITVNGTCGPSDAYYHLATSNNGYVWRKQGYTYTLSGCPSGGSSSTFYIIAFNSNGLMDYGSSATRTMLSTGNSGVAIVVRSGTTVSNLVFWPQLEIGSTATSFEKYDGTDYTISLDNTYYGGSIDLATGLMTVTVFHGVFNSPYTIVDQQTDNTYICFQQAIYGDPTHGSNSDANLACNMFSIDGYGEKLFLRGNAGTTTVALRILKSRLDVSGAVNPSNPTNQEWMDAFTAWLNTSNTIEYTYTREIPTTVQLDPVALAALAQTDKYTPRLNTVYTNTNSVQISYLKSPIRDEYEKTQAILSLGGNS